MLFYKPDRILLKIITFRRRSDVCRTNPFVIDQIDRTHQNLRLEFEDDIKCEKTLIVRLQIIDFDEKQ